MPDDLRTALQRLGATRIEAALVDLLHREPDVSTRQAVEATDLRQPEVSVGMRELVGRGWVECEPIPRQGKGRPMNRYRLVADAPRLHRHYQVLGQQARIDLEAALHTMRSTWGTV